MKLNVEEACELAQKRRHQWVLVTRPRRRSQLNGLADHPRL